MEQTKLGADMIVITNPGGAAPKEVPDLSILDGPYLFHSMADYRKLVKSDWFKSVSDRLEKEAGLSHVIPKEKSLGTQGFSLLAMMERVKGIEPSLPAWKAGVLPLNYTRV